MRNNFLVPKFFLSANTSEGFFSVFNHLYYPSKDWFCYIIKGGPGTGKSTMMKKIANEALKKFIKVEMIYCSSDPDSLDAIIFPDLKVAIVDGTSPHIVDPIFPGVSDIIINIGDCWNSKKLLKEKDKVVNLSQQNAIFHKKSKKYLKTFGVVYREINRIIEESISEESLISYCERFIKKIFNKKKNNKDAKGFEQMRIISSITPKGHIFFDDTLKSLSEKVFVIEDKYRVIGTKILKYLRNRAIELGYDLITCPSPFLPKEELDALFIPELKISFVVKEKAKGWNILQNEKFSCKKITTKRFLKNELISKHKNFILFNQKICTELFNSSVNALDDALKIHNELEKIYISSMNYAKINKITDKLISAIL